jgi:hypothetical protein
MMTWAGIYFLIFYNNYLKIMKTIPKLQAFILANILLMCQFNLSAQSPDTLWTHILGGPGYQDNLMYVIKTHDNNYIASGVLYDDFPQSDIWVIKFTENGEIIWNKTYVTDSIQPWLHDSPRGMVEIEGGEVVIFTANNYFEHYLLYLDNEGNKKTMVKYLSSEDPFYVYCGTNTTDDGFIVAGEHAVMIGNDWYHYSWYRKIDALGNLVWEYSFPPINWQDGFYCILKEPGGDFILAGTSDAGSDNDDLLLFRINALGDTVWTKRWGTSAYDNPHEITPVSDGGFVVGGTTSYMSDYDGFLLKLDPNGNEEWFHEYNSYNDDEVHSVQSTTDGGYIVTGEYKPTSAEHFLFWIMKTDALGNQIASLTLGEMERGYGESIIQTDDGGFIAAGKLNEDCIILKVSPDFGTFGINEDSSIPGDQIILHQNFPNPFSTQTNLCWQNDKGYHQSLRVYDIMGREVAVLYDGFMPAGRHTLVFDIQHFDEAGPWPDGMYLYRLISEDKVVVMKMIRL